LGAIIEKVSGQSYPASLEQYIFQPLGLQNTYYVLPPAGLSATGYSGSDSAILPVTPWDRSAAFAAGALSSNLFDLVTWENALMNGKVVSPVSFKAMTTSNGFVTQGFYPGGSSYGFGERLTNHILWCAP
jgi:CubicO group peptidase (beta-lactamase class C family)